MEFVFSKYITWERNDVQTVRGARDIPLNTYLYQGLINLLTTGTDYIRFLQFLLAHSISAFKHVANKT